MAPAKGKKTSLKIPKARVTPGNKAKTNPSRGPNGASNVKASQTPKGSQVAVTRAAKRDIYDHASALPSETEEAEPEGQQKIAVPGTKRRGGPSTSTRSMAKRQKLTQDTEIPHKPDELEFDKNQEIEIAETMLYMYRVPRDMTTPGGLVTDGPPATRTRSASVQNTTFDTPTRYKEAGQSTQALLRTPVNEEHIEDSANAHGPVTRSASHRAPNTRAPVANMGQKRNVPSATANPDIIVTEDTMGRPDSDAASGSITVAQPTPNKQRHSRQSQPQVQESSTTTAGSDEESGEDELSDETLDPTPDSVEEPELAKEFEELKLPAVGADDFFGCGQSWNELIQQRENLLKHRPELVNPKPDWYRRYKAVGSHYPMSKKGQNTALALVSNPEYLIVNWKNLNDHLKKFKKNDNRQAESLQADLCHFLIPRLVRCIHALSKKQNYFNNNEVFADRLKLQTIIVLRSLFDRLAELSEIASGMEMNDKSLGLNSDVANYLEIMQSKSAGLHKVFDQKIEQGRAEALARKDAEHQRMIEKSRAKNRRQKDKDKEYRRKQKEQENAWSRQRSEESHRHQIAERKALESEQKALRDENRRIKDRKMRIWRAKEEQRAENNRQAWDDQYEMELMRNRESANDYYIRLSQRLARQKRRSLPTLGKPGPSRLSNAGSVTWTKELSIVLINRLSLFANLSQEARYARCLDCKELQTMSIEMIRDRALDMKPTLEDWYHENEGSVPRWVRTIS